MLGINKSILYILYMITMLKLLPYSGIFRSVVFSLL